MVEGRDGSASPLDTGPEQDDRDSMHDTEGQDDYQGRGMKAT